MTAKTTTTTGGFFCDRHERFAVRDVASGEFRCPDCPISPPADAGREQTLTCRVCKGTRRIAYEADGPGSSLCYAKCRFCLAALSPVEEPTDAR